MPRQRGGILRRNGGFVDSGSTDRTLAIARSLGARVIEHEFTDYVRQKQIALDHATGAWVLLLDADETATWELGREITAAIAAPNAAWTAIGFGACSTISGTTTLGRSTAIVPIRLFRRDRGHIGGVDPHDKVVVRGTRRAAVTNPICILAIAISPTTSRR